jgi:hypothetical protein
VLVVDDDEYDRESIADVLEFFASARCADRHCAAEPMP